MYSAAKRITDGLLTSFVDSPNLQDEAAALANAVAAFGGSPDNWQLVELTSEQYQAIMAGLPGRPFLVGEVLTIATPPQTELSAGTVEADGVASITLSISVDAAYTGPAKVTITPPGQASQTETIAIVNGGGYDTISTEFEGLHSVAVDVELYGVAFTSFEGV